jgi:iron complex outermembrane receptor protein
MDNYSLRPLSAPMALEVPTTTTTWGARGRLELPAFSFGVTTETATFDATRFAGPTPATIGAVQSIMWPDVTRRQIGAYVEGVRELSDHARLRYGARADYFSAAVSRADEPTLGGDGPTPRQLWAMYTVGVDDSWSHWDGSGLLRLEHERGSWQLFAGLSRAVRVADATERFLAANSAMSAKRWVGNPGLEPARYHQLDLGAAWGRDRSGATLTLFAADVDGEILRDRARCQLGILRCDGATIHRNVQARRLGGELAGRLAVSRSLMVTGGLSWVRAENTTDGRPIAQTPPLTGHLQGVWSDTGWSAWMTIQLADRQDRVDDDPAGGSGLDAGPTPSWLTVDLAGTLELGGGLDLSCGVANLLDRAYATHLNRASLFDPDPQRVNEPGRTVWVRLRWRCGPAGLLNSR